MKDAQFELQQGLTTESLSLVSSSGEEWSLNVDRWLGPASAADTHALTRTNGRVLDVGSGPGRMLKAGSKMGIDIEGVDTDLSTALSLQKLGYTVHTGDIMDVDLPSYESFLLMDGNLGMTGDPIGLLRRLCTLRTKNAVLIVEVESPLEKTRTELVRLKTNSTLSGSFYWSWVTVQDLGLIAETGGWQLQQIWEENDRYFGELQ